MYEISSNSMCLLIFCAWCVAKERAGETERIYLPSQITFNLPTDSCRVDISKMTYAFDVLITANQARVFDGVCTYGGLLKMDAFLYSLHQTLKNYLSNWTATTDP